MRHLTKITTHIIETFMRNLLYIFLLLLLSVVSCMKDDDYTTSVSDQLTFSRDTINLDTIISGEPTRTFTFTIYNKAAKALRITNVILAKGAASPFKVNVDGVSMENGSATDFEIARKDSMIVYLMANVPITNSDQPIDYADTLWFTTEAGVRQKVVLKASGQDVKTLKGMRISQNTTFAAQRPYRVMDSLVVEQGATLTLAAGTTLMFHSNASLIVHGSLRIDGSLQQPVVLRGDRLDDMFKYQPYDRTPGLWGGVVFTSTSYDNNINYADIHSGCFGLKVDSSDVERLKLTLQNSVVHTVTGHALDIRMSQVVVGNSQITNAGGDCIHMRGGNASFTHCTVGRFYVFSGGSGHALDFANYDGNVLLPITKLQFQNSIVTGYQNDEILGSSKNNVDDDTFYYVFSHCLLNTPEPMDYEGEGEDAHFLSCLWDQKASFAADVKDPVLRDKNFTPDFNLDYLLFGFELNAQSKAIGTADATISAQTYPLDRLGRIRGAKPDMGCYQHQTVNDNK